MDHAANVFHEQPQELITDHVDADTKGFPSGHYDTLVLTSYADHVAARVWVGEVVICYEKNVFCFQKFVLCTKEEC